MTQFVPLLIYKVSRYAEEKGRVRRRRSKGLSNPEAIGQERRPSVRVLI